MTEGIRAVTRCKNQQAVGLRNTMRDKKKEHIEGGKGMTPMTTACPGLEVKVMIENTK